jgi:hypothetical protein
VTLPAGEFPADEEKAIAAFIEDLSGGGGNLKLDPWMHTVVVPKAMARIIDMHVPDATGACYRCGHKPCPLRQTALAYVGGLVADGANFDGVARPVMRGVARVPEPPMERWPRPYVAWHADQPPTGGAAS